MLATLHHPRARSRTVRAAATPTDAELVIAAAGGDRFAWVLIWQRYSRVVRRYLARQVHHEENVDDLLQETFVILYTSIARIERPQALRSFLFGIAARVAMAARRKGRRLARHIGLTPDGNLPDRAAGDEEPPLELERALGLLPPRYSEALVLRHLSGFQVQEVASKLNISTSSARRWIARAHRQVKRFMHA